MALCPTDAIIGGIKNFPQFEEKVSDLVSSIYTFSLGFTSLIFPIIGSAIAQAVGFRLTIDIMSIILLINASVYLTSTIVDWRREKANKREKIDKVLLALRKLLAEEEEKKGLLETIKEEDSE